ncbi:AraC family transcriptional regulator [uncultured Chryseobacterium sp.]|uniref:helix-turn-helix domain-containing protein n=1 Tax=uncultured Chryseobacterium sp. TaxID=259322 RepID=UPI0025E5B17B|nr:helix-turn-helix domain-containing protein [uncultured Chryseobacterium sp.]
MNQKKILLIFFFISLKIYSQSTSDLRLSLEIDSLIKKDQWNLVHYKLSNENIKFKRLSNYNIKYDLLIRIDSATVLYENGKFSDAEKSVLHFLDLIQKNKKKITCSYYETLKHLAIIRLFYIEKRKGNTAKALRYIHELSKGMNPIYKKKQLIFFATAYVDIRNYTKGIELLDMHLNDIRYDTENKLYPVFLKAKETATTYNTKSDAFINWYQDTGEKRFLDSSRHNYEKAYSLMKNAPYFSAYSKALYKYRKAQTALLKKQYNLSLYLFNECEKDSVLMQKNFSREAVWLGKAEIFTNLKKNDLASWYLGKLSANINHSKCSYVNKLKTYHLLSVNFEHLGDIQNAYKYAKLSLVELQKENIQKNKDFFFLGIFEKNEIENVSKEILSKRNKNILFTFLYSLIIFIFLYIMYTRYGKKNNKRNADTITNKKNTAISAIEEELAGRILIRLEQLELKKEFLSNDFKLANLAKQLNTNTAYLSQIINHYKSKTFSEYVNNLRMNYILKELEINPVIRKYNIEVISREIGYKSCTTFIKVFKQRTKMIPSDYIKRL